MKYLKTFENKEPEKKVIYHDNGNIKIIEYRLKGKKHREDGPAVTGWYEDGEKYCELYFINDKYHREDGPAFQYWHENGTQATELYLINGIYHREDGPAKIFWYENGIKEEKNYFINNNEYDRKEWIEKLKEINYPHYEEQKILYDMEIYNI